MIVYILCFILSSVFVNFYDKKSSNEVIDVISVNFDLQQGVKQSDSSVNTISITSETENAFDVVNINFVNY